MRSILKQTSMDSITPSITFNNYCDERIRIMKNSANEYTKFLTQLDDLIARIDLTMETMRSFCWTQRNLLDSPSRNSSHSDYPKIWCSKLTKSFPRSILLNYASLSKLSSSSNRFLFRCFILKLFYHHWHSTCLLTTRWSKRHPRQLRNLCFPLSNDHLTRRRIRQTFTTQTTWTHPSPRIFWSILSRSLRRWTRHYSTTNDTSSRRKKPSPSS